MGRRVNRSLDRKQGGSSASSSNSGRIQHSQTNSNRCYTPPYVSTDHGTRKRDEMLTSPATRRTTGWTPLPKPNSPPNSVGHLRTRKTPNGPKRPRGRYSKMDREKQYEAARNRLNLIESYLTSSSNPYLMGEKASHADFALFAAYAWSRANTEMAESFVAERRGVAR